MEKYGLFVFHPKLKSNHSVGLPKGNWVLVHCSAINRNPLDFKLWCPDRNRPDSFPKGGKPIKITNEIILTIPRQKVWEVFDNPDNLPKWQPTLIKFEPQSGEPGQPGSRSKLTYDEGGREVVLIETITSRAEPDEFNGTYETEDTLNKIRNTFIEMGPNQTRWIMESEFQFSGVMRWMAPIMKGFFRKRTQENMQRFKTLAETDETG